MLRRHDFVTPCIDGIRFFDKPPLMYWLAAGSMHLFGVHDWAGRLPLALLTLALLLATYALGLRLFERVSPSRPSGPRSPLFRSRAGYLHRPLSLHAFLHPGHPYRALDDARRTRISRRATRESWLPKRPDKQTVSAHSLPRLRSRHCSQPAYQGIDRPRLPTGLRVLYLAFTRQLRRLRSSISYHQHWSFLQ